MKKKYLIILLFLFLASAVQAKKIVKMAGVFNPTQIHVTKDRLYIVDGFTILIYALKDFQLIKKIGKEGEGPREFKDAIYWIYFRGNRMIVNSQAKVSYIRKRSFMFLRRRGNSWNEYFCPSSVKKNFLINCRRNMNLKMGSYTTW